MTKLYNQNSESRDPPVGGDDDLAQVVDWLRRHIQRRDPIPFAAERAVFLLESQAATIATLQRDAERTREAIEDALEFVAGYVDVTDGDYGQPSPNKAMRLTTRLEEALADEEPPA